MGMEKPPSKEQLLLEWFLGDSKEILDELKGAMAQAQDVQQSMLSAGAGIGAQVDEAKAELVAAYRALVSATREAESRQRTLLQAVDSTLMQRLEKNQRRTLLAVACFALTGGMVGGIGAALLLMRQLNGG